MHELAITENILEIANRHAEAAGAKKVTFIYLQIGSLSSVVDDSVQFYWDIIAQDTLCAGANLVFERTPAELLCLECQNKYTLSGELTPCPRCASSRVKVIQGDEFRVESIEIET